MASKLAAAKIAAWSGVRAVIASASVPNVVLDAFSGNAVGTSFAPRATRLSSRKLWIAFAQGSAGRITVDAGARRALVEGGKSLLAAGVRDVEGAFDVDSAVEIVGDDHRGLRQGTQSLRRVATPVGRGQAHGRPPGRLPARGRTPRRSRRPALTRMSARTRYGRRKRPDLTERSSDSLAG